MVGLEARRWAYKHLIVGTIESEPVTISVFRTEEKRWVVLKTGFESLQLVRFWEEIPPANSGVPDGISEDLLIGVISSIISQCEDFITLSKACNYNPRGWRYWGFGIPNPVSDYITYEFDEDIAKLLSEKDKSKY